MRNIALTFPGQSVAPNAEYPGGSGRNIVTSGDGTGTPWDRIILNDFLGAHQGAVTSTGQNISDVNETALVSQFVQALATYAAASQFYTDTGAADVYVLTVIGAMFAPPAYVDGMLVRSIVANTNTGGATIDVAGIGVVPLFVDGVAAVAGDIEAGKRFTAVFDAANVRFDIPVVAATGGGGNLFDVINELTLNAGTTVESVLIKDGDLLPALFGASMGNVIQTWANLFVDNITADVFDELTPAAGHTFNDQIKAQAGLRIDGGVINHGLYTTIPINSGIISSIANLIRLAPETGASDTLENIFAGTNGDRITLTPLGPNTITVDDAAGNIFLDGGGNFVMNSTRDRLVLEFDSPEWVEISRSNN